MLILNLTCPLLSLNQPHETLAVCMRQSRSFDYSLLFDLLSPESQVRQSVKKADASIPEIQIPHPRFRAGQ